MLTAARRRPRVAAGGAIIAGLTLAPLLLPAGHARADIVRSDQAWVLAAVDAPAAWQVTMGQGVTVAVIDSGTNPDVSNLQGSVTPGPDYTGVGTSPGSPGWGVHGTWMASLVAGHGNGSDGGILGTAPRARVLAIRVITDRADPGFAAYQREQLSRGQRALASAISYAVSHRAGVISMSLGYDMASKVVRSALQSALDHGVVVVASAGNSGDAADSRGDGRAPYSFPADYPGVLGVGAVDQGGRPASFSSANLSVQVAAPGVKVPAQGRDGQYWLVSGTSPACALTAGVAALIKSRYPRLAPALVGRALITTTRDPPRGGYDGQVGFGTVDAAAALTAAARLDAAAGRAGSDHSGVSVSEHFGGGPAAVPPAPVKPRGPGVLILLIALGAGCLAVVVLATWRLLSASGRRRTGLPAGPPGGQPGGPAAWPAAGGAGWVAGEAPGGAAGPATNGSAAAARPLDE